MIDNYLKNVTAMLRPFASILAILVMGCMIAGILLAVMSDPAQAGPLTFCAIVGVFLAMAMTKGARIVSNSFGFVGEARHKNPARKYPIQKKSVLLAANLNLANVTSVGAGQTPFPFGCIYRTMFLEFTINLTIGTGSGAVSEGELLFIKNIFMKTDKHGPIVNNLCGRALYRTAQKKMQTAAYKDAMAASTGAYTVSIPIYFANEKLRRPDDTSLDMTGVKSLELLVTLGSVSDLLTTPGTATATCTVDISLERSQNPPQEGDAPTFQPYLSQLAPIDPSVNQYIELEKTPGLAILDLMMFSTNSATAGIPFSGTPSNNTIKRFSYMDNIQNLFDEVPVNTIQNDNKLKFKMETKIPGCYLFDFTEDNSVWSAYPIWNKAVSRIKWTNDTLSTSQVSGVIDGLIPLKDAPDQQ